MSPQTTERRLTTAVKDLLSAIRHAQEVGLLDHTDCWDDADKLLWQPISRAERLLEELTQERVK